MTKIKTVTPQKVSLVKPPKHIVISHGRAPGDITVLTALVRDIALSRPGEFVVDVDTTSPEIWQNNPYVTPFRKHAPPGTIYHRADYGLGIKESEYRTIHFMAYFHEDFFHKQKIRIPVMRPYPDLHLSEAEKTQKPINGKYWLCLPGGKTDFTAKLWSINAWTELVGKLAGDGIACVQAGNANTAGTVKHINPTIPGMALNLVGKTSLRELIRLIYHSEGVICGVTCAMHMAAALERPCVCVAGSRETPHWEFYGLGGIGIASPEIMRQLKVPHRYLHNVTQLDCAKFHGCGLCLTTPTDPARTVCKNPIIMPGQAVPLCLNIITPDMVRTAVLSYYLDGTLPELPAGLKQVDVGGTSR